MEEEKNTGGMKLSVKKMESRTVRSMVYEENINGHQKASSTMGRSNHGKEHQDLNLGEIRTWKNVMCSDNQPTVLGSP